MCSKRCHRVGLVLEGFPSPSHAAEMGLCSAQEKKGQIGGGHGAFEEG